MTPLTVVGSVVDSDGKPLSGANVAAGGFNQRYNWDAGATVTDNKGRFAIEFPTSAENAPINFAEVEIVIEGPQDGQTIATHFRHPVELGTDDVLVEVPAPTACESSLEELLAGATACGTPLLPDLVPMLDGLDFSAGNQPPPLSVSVDTTSQPGRVLLRFASATANLGAGMLHMIPEAEPSEDRATTWQRIWTDQARYVDLRTGSFVHHPTHNHFHLDGFEQYRLLSTDGSVVATGEKVSFCLIDVLKADGVEAPIGFGVFLAFQCREAGDQQVLNPGWADYYGASLDDQWIDITGVGPGDYLVEMIADPDNVLVESDESNNSVQFPVTLTAQELGIDS